MTHAEGQPLQDKFLGELEPQAQLTPPELFKTQTESHVVEMVAVGNQMVAITKDDKSSGESYHIESFTQSGEPIEIYIKKVGIDLGILVDSDWDPRGDSIVLSNIGHGSHDWRRHAREGFLENLFKKGYNNAQIDSIVKMLDAELKKNPDLAEGLKRVQVASKRQVVGFLKKSPNLLLTQPLITSGQDNQSFSISYEGNPDHFVSVPEGGFREVGSNTEAVLETLEKSKAGVMIDRSSQGIVTLSSEGIALNSFKTASAALDDKEISTLYFATEDGRQVQRVDLERVKAGIWRPEAVEIDLPEDCKVEKVLVDPHGNFLGVEYSSQGNNKLSICEKESGNTLFTFNETSPVMTFDPLGNIFYIDQSKRLRKIQTNFSKIPAGGTKELFEARQRRLEEMAQRIGGLTLPEAAAQEPKRVIRVTSEEGIVSALEKRITGLVTEQLASANTVEELAQLRSQVAVLAEQEEFANYPQAFAASERMILEKENGLRVGALETRAGQIQTEFGEIGSLQEAASLRTEVGRLKAERALVSILDPEKRSLIDARLKTLETQAEQAMNNYMGELNQSIEASLQGLKNALSTASNEAEIGQIYADPNFVQITSLLTYIQDPIARQEYQQKITEAIAAQRREVATSAAQFLGPEQYQRASSQQIASEILSELTRELANIKTGEDLRRFRNNPLAVQFLQHAGRVDESIKREAEVTLEKLIDERKSALETERQLERLKSGEVIRFNGVEFPIFSPPPPEFETKVSLASRVAKIPRTKYASTSEYVRASRQRRAMRERKEVHLGVEEKRYEIEFVDKRGAVYSPSVRVPQVELDNVLKEETVKARHFFESRPRRVPTVPPDWKMTPYYRELMAHLAEELNIQTEIQEGLVILEGDAGVGKNAIIDTLAALSNREVFFVPCHAQMDKEDLTYTVEYDPKLGTVKKQASLIEALNTPGSVVIFNEVNTAPPGVVKMTNPLTDYMRTMYLSFGGENHAVKPDPSVLLLGVMNPQTYLGTKPLAQDFSSRATIIRVDYPPQRDEASIVASKVDSLKGLQLEEFEKLWEYAIDGNRASGGDQYSTPQTEEDLRNIRVLVRAAEKIRTAHHDYMTRQSDEVVDFVFTMRETRNIAIRYNREKKLPEGKRKDMKSLILDTIIPKIPDSEEQERVRTIVENI